MAGKIFSDIYNESARDTGDTTSSHVTYVKKKVNDALREICSMMNFSWMKRVADITLVASQQYVNIADFASDWDEDTPVSIWYRGADNQKAELEAYDENEWDVQEDLDEGNPFGFHISAKEAGIWKVYFTYVPDSNFVTDYSPLKCRYIKSPTELSADGDIPELPTSQHQALVYFTNKLISAEMGDDQGMMRWDKLANDSLGLLKKKQVHRLGRSKRVYPRMGVRCKGSARSRRDYNI